MEPEHILKNGLYFGDVNQISFSGCEGALRCDRCGKTYNENPKLHFELVPQKRAFIYRSNPKLAIEMFLEKIFECICEECLTEKDRRDIETFNRVEET